MKKILFLLVSSLLLAAAAWLGLPHWPATVAADGTIVRVAQGSSLNRLAAQLAGEGVAPQWVVRAVGTIHGNARRLRAGEYVFQSPQTVGDLLTAIEAGDARQLGVTVVEGTTLRDLYTLLQTPQEGRQLLAADSLPSRETLRAAVMPPDSPLAAEAKVLGFPAEASLEGFFFPDTYYVAPGSSAVVLLRAMQRRMQQELALAWSQRAADTPLKSPYEALILASIIEKETGRPNDRPLVGSVFTNRLRVDMRLQTDPTVIYGLGEQFDGNLRRIHLQTDTPYNTYTRAGLPPTPIAFPGRASLRAAVAPPKSEFYYFVARGDGSSEFSRNLAEHNRAVNQYQRGGGS